MIMARFKAEVETILLKGGWFPGRYVPDKIKEWRKVMDSKGGFEMSSTAEKILLEFGGLNVGENDAGIDCAKSNIEFDPTRAIGEEDSFFCFLEDANSEKLYPLGEVIGGHCFLGIAPNGATYIVGDTIEKTGSNFDQALENLLLGIKIRA